MKKGRALLHGRRKAKGRDGWKEETEEKGLTNRAQVSETMLASSETSVTKVRLLSE